MVSALSLATETKSLCGISCELNSDSSIVDLSCASRVFLIDISYPLDGGYIYITHCVQAKIEAGSHALVVPTELIPSVIICVFCIAEMDKVDNKSSFMQLKSI